MKMQEILNVVAKDYPLTKITESKNKSRGCNLIVDLSCSIEDFERMADDDAIRFMQGAVHYLQVLMGDVIVNNYNIPYTTEDTEIIKHYLIGDVPVEIIDDYYPGTLRKIAKLLISYNNSDDNNVINVPNETMSVADKIRLFTDLLKDDTVDQIVKSHNHNTVHHLIENFANIAKSSKIDESLNYFVLLSVRTDHAEFSKYTTRKTNLLPSNIKALLLSDVGDGEVIKIEKQEK